MPFSTTEDKILASVSESINPYGVFTCAEYFAGIGLVRLGLEQAGWKIIFSNDWSHSKYEMYSAHFKDASEHYKVQDIFSIRPTDIPNTLLATASFPCIDLSLSCLSFKFPDRFRCYKESRGRNMQFRSKTA